MKTQYIFPNNNSSSFLLFFFLLIICDSCQWQSRQDDKERIDSLINAKVQASKAEIEERARKEAEERVRLEQEIKEREVRERLESVRPSGNSLKEREMRYYYDQGYDFGSHPVFSTMDDEWMRKAFLYVVSQHNMSHAGNQTLQNSFMAGVAQGRVEFKDLQN